MANFIYQLKRVKWKDVKEAWKLPVSIICAPFYKLKHNNLWIICEDPNEARDNGYWLFKYIVKEHPKQDVVYAIKKGSPDYNKVHDLGRTVEFGSLRHWILYLVASKKISSQKAGNPNAAIFYFLEVYGLLKDKRVFLQHGIIINDLKWLYYNVTKMNRFICGAFPEYKFIQQTFGYPKKNVVYTGLCRFDGLHDATYKSNFVLIMPTWREWIADEDYRLKLYEGTTNIKETNYFKKWRELIENPEIERLSNKYGIKFVFFPHRNMQRYLNYFPETNEYLEVADANKYDVQGLLKMSSMMVTDYSSVFMDMIYMKKPIVFYQFDYEKFRQGQYGEGYFDYRDNPFGRSFRQLSSVFEEIEVIIKNNYDVSNDYLSAHREFFPLFDTNNCKRIYEVTEKL